MTAAIGGTAVRAKRDEGGDLQQSIKNCLLGETDEVPEPLRVPLSLCGEFCGDVLTSALLPRLRMVLKIV